MNKQNLKPCPKCGKYHDNIQYNPLEQEVMNLRTENERLRDAANEVIFAANRRNNDDDFAELLAYSEALENANNENMATVEVLQRELHDARRELDLARAELRISHLEYELEKRKSAKWDKNPWPGYAYDPVWKDYQVGDTFNWGTISSTNATIDPKATKAHYTYCEDE